MSKEPFVVSLAYRLGSSDKYTNYKLFFHNLLNNNTYRYKKYFDVGMIVLILISVGILVYDVTNNPNPTLEFLNNIIITIIFAIEYLLRLWLCSDSSKILIDSYRRDALLKRPFRLHVAIVEIVLSKLKYMITPTAIIDLLAILPFFHALRALRLFVVFRILKLFHYTQNMHHFAQILSTKKFELYTLLTFVGLIVFVSSIIIYTMEARNPNGSIRTLFDAFYWSIVTMSTVGYGDVAPISSAGRVVAMVVIMAGVAVLAFATSIVVSAFTQKLDDIRQTRVLQKAKKLQNLYLICGYTLLSAQCADELRKLKRSVLILEDNAQRASMARIDDHLVLELSASSLLTYDMLGVDLLERTSSALLLADSDVENVYTALTIRSLSTKLNTLSILKEKRNRKKLLLAGSDRVVYTEELLAQLSHKHSTNPQAYEMLHSLRVVDSKITAGEIVATSSTVLAQIEQSRHSVIVVGVYRRGRFIFNPDRDLEIEIGSRVVIIAHTLIIEDLQRSLA